MRKLILYSPLFRSAARRIGLRSPRLPTPPPTVQCLFEGRRRPSLPTPCSSFSFSLRSVSSTTRDTEEDLFPDEPGKEELEKEGLVIVEWEEEDDAESEVGDGGDGGGIVLQNVPWGERVLSIAREVLEEFDKDLELFAFKTTPRGYIYVRLDKISNEYGCPSIEEIESYSRQYNKRLDEEGLKGTIPNDLALEVSSPGAERILRVPDDLDRFRDFAMVVFYVEQDDCMMNSKEKSGVFLLDSLDTDAENCSWKLADVRENRNPLSKGRPLSAKQKHWRLKLPFQNLRKVTLYLGGLSD
ncbi:hypothetical protein Droror1_Dr00003460 [Drosera rotundifolia]